MIVYATTSLAYSKDYVFVSRPTCIRHCYNIILSEFFIFFSMTSWLVTITMTMSYDVTDVWQHDHNVTSNPNPKFKMEK